MREFLLKARYNPETKEVSIKTVDIEGQKHRYVVQVKPTTSWHNWVVKYHARDQIDVLEFMHAFLKHNVDSTQLKCQLALQAAAENKKNHISILNAIRIVDPTFWVRVQIPFPFHFFSKIPCISS